MLLSPVRIDKNLIRVGGNSDGSYLIPQLELNFDGVVSPGVGQTFDFESAIVGADCRVVLIDGTVEKPGNLPPNFIFIDRMLGALNGELNKTISLEEITKEYFPNANSLVLQMDIEGGEYEVLNTLGNTALAPYSLILVEFHHFHQLNKNLAWNSKIENAIQVLQKDFLLVHSHPNNAGGFFLWRFKKIPKVVETTWVRKSLLDLVDGPAKLPHPLDRRNDLLMEDLQFPNFRLTK